MRLLENTHNYSSILIYEYVSRVYLILQSKYFVMWRIIDNFDCVFSTLYRFIKLILL